MRNVRALGVGEAQILGRVHYVKITIEGREYVSSLSVLREQGGSKQADILIGLDFLRKHKCKVNLNTHSLDIGKLILHLTCVQLKMCIGTTGVQIPFLTEGELPQRLRPLT